jgi:uncharacterized protein (TIGR02598 family)
MTRRSKRATHKAAVAFSLVEVLIALGVIAIAITAILGVLPTALQTGHSAQDDTRGAEIAQTIFGSLVAQAPSQFSNIQLPLLGNTTLSPAINLTSSSSPTTPTLYAGNDGQLMPSQSAASAYAIMIFTNNSPPGFTDVGYANQVTVRVAWPANASAANQTIRDYVRIITKY